jgi:hypothetical protein
MVEGSHDEVMQLTPPGDKIDPRYQSGSGNHITTPSQALPLLILPVVLGSYLDSFEYCYGTNETKRRQSR